MKPLDPVAELRAGDVLQGTGRIKVLVEILAVDGDAARVRLVRPGSASFGNEKMIKLRTLRVAYEKVAPAGGRRDAD